MEFISDKVIKSVTVSDGKIIDAYLINRITGRKISQRGYEFGVAYRKNKKFAKAAFFNGNDAAASETSDGLEFSITHGGVDWKIKVIYTADEKSGVLRKNIRLSATDESVIIDYIDLDCFDVSGARFRWDIPKAEKRVYIPSYVTTMGQPYYVEDTFFGGEFPTADNRITDGNARSRYYIGRSFSEIAADGVYKSVPFVMGSGRQADFYAMRNDFFEYIDSIRAQKVKLRVQYNSWYDNMLDINSEKIKNSFVQIADGFKKAGFRPLDCYVVDDGWIDYTVPEFWAFDKAKFPENFDRESKLTEELNSTFGVWFGPRGGYTSQTPKYAKLLNSIGYHDCRQSHDICTGNPKYVHDLCERMADFCVKYNVSYFKIDGFAVTPCRSKKHGHPKGSGDGLSFYTYLWEEWIKGFELIRKTRPDVFLNVTSYAHCSPWFLRWCDAVWLNNCADMGYSGIGNNLNQCLNYRDNKYEDFFEVRKLQFPASSIYNHEPCYAVRNCNPPMTGNMRNPDEKHPTVIYATSEFKTYLYYALMRGTGFVELYFSPALMDDEKYAAAAEALHWAEDNFEIIKCSRYVGGNPENKEICGYYASNKRRAFLALRNPSDVEKTYDFCRQKLDFDDAPYDIREFYPQTGETLSIDGNGVIPITLKPYEIKIFEIAVRG